MNCGGESSFERTFFTERLWTLSLTKLYRAAAHFMPSSHPRVPHGKLGQLMKAWSVSPLPGPLSSVGFIKLPESLLPPISKGVLSEEPFLTRCHKYCPEIISDYYREELGWFLVR